MLHVVQRELHYIVNLSLAVLDHIIHMSSCNNLLLCFRQIMDYSYNHRSVGTPCSTNRVQCKLSCEIYSNIFVTSSFPYSDN